MSVRDQSIVRLSTYNVVEDVDLLPLTLIIFLQTPLQSVIDGAARRQLTMMSHCSCVSSRRGINGSEGPLCCTWSQ
jgi:hypothetical protein